MKEHIFTFQNRKTGASISCSIQRIGLEQLDALMEFQQQLYTAIPNKDTYKPLARDEYIFMIEHGFLEGVYWQEQLIYFLGCLYPSDDNLGIDLQLPKSEWEHVAHLEAGMTHPDFRNFGIHSYMISHCLQLLQTDGRTHWVCCTVSPLNLPSLKALLHAGMEIAMVKEKYGGLLRYIMLKKF